MKVTLSFCPVSSCEAFGGIQSRMQLQLNINHGGHLCNNNPFHCVPTLRIDS